MTHTHIPVRSLVVGDVLSDGAEVTMVGASCRHRGSHFIAAKLPSGRFWSTALLSESLIAVRAA